MSEQLRKEVFEFLMSCLYESMFGDRMEEEYILNGISFKGLTNMTDQELLAELLCHTGDDEPVVVRVKTELGLPTRS